LLLEMCGSSGASRSIASPHEWFDGVVVPSAFFADEALAAEAIVFDALVLPLPRRRLPRLPTGADHAQPCARARRITANF
jgi:hypothetical protein